MATNKANKQKIISSITNLYVIKLYDNFKGWDLINSNFYVLFYVHFYVRNTYNSN